MTNQIALYEEWCSREQDEAFLEELSKGNTWARACAISGYDRSKVEERAKNDRMFQLAIAGAERNGREAQVDNIVDIARDGIKVFEEGYTVDADGNKSKTAIKKSRAQSIKAAELALKILDPTKLEKKVTITTVNKVMSDEDLENARNAIGVMLELKAKEKATS